MKQLQEVYFKIQMKQVQCINTFLVFKSIFRLYFGTYSGGKNICLYQNAHKRRWMYQGLVWLVSSIASVYSWVHGAQARTRSKCATCIGLWSWATLLLDSNWIQRTFSAAKFIVYSNQKWLSMKTYHQVVFIIFIVTFLKNDILRKSI